MYHVYVLKSQSSNHFYTGQTDNLQRRIGLHNRGKVKWAKRYKPWKLIFKEKCADEISAIRREKYLKSHAGRKWLKSKFMGL